ncbi:MAG TPA: NUDIX hydrolase [Acidobacteriaceae bacterium]|nr:NUDIX hydrolase [Acidobacteriaceae bacterium]
MTSREYPERPWVGVGALIFREGRVLLVRRGHAPSLGEWSIPGGALELGETLAEGVKREVREETGLEVEPVATVDVVDRIARDETGRVQFHYVLVDFLCRVTGGSEAFADDAVGLRWAAMDDLEEAAPFTREVIAKARNMAENYAPPFHS